MLRIISFLIIMLSFFSAQANDDIIDIPSTYNGVRCQTESSGDFYMNFYRGQLDSMYWIANDHVAVLSTSLTAAGNRVTGRDREGGVYIYDHGTSDFQHLNSSRQEIVHHQNMHCVLCPADQPKCPGY